jgi:hypothetical protein
MRVLRDDIRRLQQKAADLAEDLDALIALQGVDVPSSLNKIRFITEKVLQGLCKSNGVSWGPAEPTLERMLGPLVSADCLPRSVAVHVRTIQINTSPGSHYQESALSATHVAIAGHALVEFLEWHCRQSEPLAGPAQPKATAADPAGRGPTAAAPAADVRGRAARRRRLALAAGAVAVLLVLGVAGWLILAATRHTSPGVTGTPSTEPSAAPPLTGWVDVRVWEGKKVAGPRNPHRRGLYLHQLDALPLKVGDEIQVEAELTQPMFVYVVWINAAGQALPVYPWRQFQWEQRPAEERAVARLKLPAGAADDGWEMDEGVAGMETLLLLARATKLTDAGEAELKAALAEVGPQPLQDGKTEAAIWFENGAVVTAEAGRAPKSFDVRRIEDPVLRAQRVLCDRLGQWFEYTRAVSFAFRGK